MPLCVCAIVVQAVVDTGEDTTRGCLVRPAFRLTCTVCPCMDVCNVCIDRVYECVCVCVVDVDLAACMYSSTGMYVLL